MKKNALNTNLPPARRQRSFDAAKGKFFSGDRQPAFSLCATKNGLARLLPVWLLAFGFCAVSARAATLVQDFYLPMPEAQINQANAAIVSGTGPTINSTFSIVITGDGTVIYYDQWEDGYETDLGHPTQSTTQIWGDGNDAHGIPPGFAHNPQGLPAGTVITLTNAVTLPRNPSTILWDARDHVAATKALVISRAAWPLPTGPVFAGAVGVLSTSDYGTNYISPVGQDLTNNLFKYVGLFIMAAENNTAVIVDPNGNGVGITNIVLNQGESYLVNGGIKKGGRVTATKPIQADIIIGHVGASYASDWFTLYPFEAWSSSYYTPVGSAATISQPAYVYLFNPNANAITVNYKTQSGAGSLSVPGTNGVIQFQMPVNSGGSFICTNGQNFFAVCTAAANNSADTSYNWGFTLVPVDALTTEATVGWGPGSADGTVDGSPVWATTLANTKIYVDYKGDHAGLLTDPNGNHYDTNFTVAALQSQKIYDPSKNQTGMRVYTLDGTLLTAAWGEDPDVAAPGNPYIDAGTTVLPFPIPKIIKSADEYSDTGTPGFSVGDTVRYTVEVDNKGLAPLGNLVVIDAPPTNLLSYVVDSTTLDGNPIPDSATGTPFPLDNPGYTIPVILKGGTSTFQYLCTIIAPGMITNTAGTTPYNIMAQAQVATPGTNNPNPQCFIDFTDAGGTVVSSYLVGGNIYVTLTNAVGNTSSNTVQFITVTVQDVTRGDLENILLSETGTNTGVFRNATGLPTSASAGLGQQDGTVYVIPGDVLSVSYIDPNFGNGATDTTVIQIPSLTKQLYLSINGLTNGAQYLNRVDPVANEHGPTRTSADLGSGGGSGTITVDSTTYGSSGTANVTSLTNAHTTASGANYMLVAVALADYTGNEATVSTVKYGSQSLTFVGGVSSTNHTSTVTPRIEVWGLANPTVGTANVIITASASRPIAAGVATFIGVNTLGTFVSNRSTNTTGGTSSSVTVTTTAGQLVFDLGVVGNSAAVTTMTVGGGQTSLWSTNANNGNSFVWAGGSISNASGSSVTMSRSWTGNNGWAIAAVPLIPATGSGGGTNVTTFTQTPAFCSAFTMLSNNYVTITNYITVTNGTMPANPAVTAILLHNGTNFLTITNPVYSSTGSNLVWSALLSGNVIIQAGEVISYVITNSQSGVAFHTDYDSTNKPSKITLPTSTVIAINTIGVYDAPYPNGNPVTAPVAGAPLFVRVNVGDPFGSYDITSLGLAITGPNSGANLSTNLVAANVVANDGCSKTYEFAWPTGPTTGGYNIAATANEGTEGITATAATSVSLIFLDLGTPSTTEFTSGNNGVRTNLFATNGIAWIRVTDMNRNTNTTTAQSVAVTATSSSGDTEPVTLTETSTNSGVFTGSISLTNTATANNSGKLTAPQGSLIQVTYTDLTDPSDVTSDTASVPMPVGTGAVRVTATLQTPNPTQVGNPVQFNIQVVNTGSTNLPTVTLTNSFPTNALTFVSASAPPGTVTGTNLIWNNIGPLAPGQSTNLSLTFTASGSASPATDAAAAGGGGGVNGSSSANVTITRPALAITKIKLSPTNSVVSIQSNVVFQIVIQNTGNTTIPNIPLEDDYSAAAFQYVSAIIPPDGSGGGILIWTNIVATNALTPNASLTNLVTMKVIGQGYPAHNTAHADFATDANGSSVPAAASTASVTNSAALISGSVYDDLDQSGTLTAGDVGLGGATVQLYTDPNGDGNPSDGTLVQTTATDSGGYYEFLNLPANTYTIVETDLPGYISKSPANNRIPVNVNSLTTFSNNYFFDCVLVTTNYASVGGHVWFDSNQNGVHDGGEPGVTNAFVELVQDVNTNGLADLGEPAVASASADNTGQFIFQSVAPGNYVVRETDFFGWASTADSQGANDNQVAVTLGSGATVTNVWFLDYSAGGGNGYYPPVAAPDSYETFEDNLLSVSAANGVFANDFCTSGASNLTAVLVATTTNGTLMLNTNNGAFTYTPNTKFFGTDTFAYRVNDGTSNSGIAAVTITVAPVNDPPSFTKGSDQTVLEDAGTQSVANWATAISPGPTNESSQTVTFQVANNNNSLFSVQPAISAAGTLTYTPATNANGSATVTVYAQDSGGTANGGVDVSATNTFTITATPVNDPPDFSLSTNNVAVLEDAGAQTNANFLTNISVGPANESAQTLAFFVSNNNSNLFTVQPAISTNGTLTFTAVANTSGAATVTVYAQDDGGTANGGNDTSATNTFTITVTTVNDPPSFTKGSDQTALEDSGLQTVPNWATNISAGPANESSQVVSFVVSNNNSNLFLVQPSVSANGTLTYTPATNANGSATVMVYAQDNGGTTDGGNDTSATQTFTINVTPVNDPPGFTKGSDQTVLENSGAQTVPNWAAAISAGPADESSQVVSFVVSNSNSNLFLVQPSISSGGTLTYTPATSANGSATVTVYVQDNGGTADGGVDTSASQTFTINVTAVNQPPDFTKGSDQAVLEDSDPQTVPNWATAISAGPANESSQVVSFVVSNNNSSLFLVQPSVSANGTLTYTPATNANGSATVTIYAQDNGGTANGGNDMSATQTFNINVTAVNDPPTLNPVDSVNLVENWNLQTVNLAGITPGPTNESSQALTITAISDNPLFVPNLTVNYTNPGATGSLTFTPATNFFGTVTITVIVRDNGGTANGGVDSVTNSFPVTETGITNYWFANSNLTVKVFDANGGPGSGYSQTNYTGVLDVLANSTNPFTIKLDSFNGGSPGPAANFDNNSNYVWTVATTTRGVIDITTNQFIVDTSAFTNDLAGGTFSVASSDDDKSVNVIFAPNHDPVANPVNFNRNWGTFLRIPITNLLASATDPDGDPITLVMTGTSTNGSWVSTVGKYVVIAPTNNISESFVYVVRDVRSYRSGDTVRMATNWFTVNVTYAYGLAQSVTVSGPTAIVHFAGVPGYSYEVERSTNLTSPGWTVLLITNAPPKGVWQFIDTNPPTGGAYYRTRQH